MKSISFVGLIVSFFIAPCLNGQTGVLTGGWDSRLGDQWGLTLAGDSFLLGGAVGGFFTAGVASDAEDIWQSTMARYGGAIQGEVDDVLSWTVFGAYAFGDEPGQGSYAGVGYSSVDISNSISANNVAGYNSLLAEGDFTDGAFDIFGGYMGTSGNWFFDLRFGYGISSSASFDVSVDIDGNRFNFDQDDFPELEFEFLDGFYAMVTIGWSWGN